MFCQVSFQCILCHVGEKLKVIEISRFRSFSYIILDSIVVSIPACHAGDRGSIPRRGDVFCTFFLKLFLSHIHNFSEVHIQFTIGIYTIFIEAYRHIKSLRRLVEISFRFFTDDRFLAVNFPDHLSKIINSKKKFKSIYTSYGTYLIFSIIHIYMLLK